MTTGFSDHNTSGSAATLTFTLNPTSLPPNDVVAAPFVVRLAANTTNNADVVIAAPTSTGTITALTYEVVRVATFAGCTAAAVDSTGTSLIPAGTAMNAVAGPNTFALAKGAPVTAAGASQVLSGISVVGTSTVTVYPEYGDWIATPPSLQTVKFTTLAIVVVVSWTCST